MSVSMLRAIFEKCNIVMNYKFNMLGNEDATLYGVMLYGLTIGVVLYFILWYFHKD